MLGRLRFLTRGKNSLWKLLLLWGPREFCPSVQLPQTQLMADESWAGPDQFSVSPALKVVLPWKIRLQVYLPFP